MALLHAHLASKNLVTYTGRSADANKLAHILPIFQSFVLAHEPFMKTSFGYVKRADQPGQKARIFGACVLIEKSYFGGSRSNNTDGGADGGV